MARREAVIIVGHGDREGETIRVLQRLMPVLQERLGMEDIVPALLGMNPPEAYLGTVLESLALQGCKRVRLLPFFLVAGGHVRRDLPAICRETSLRFPGFEVVQLEPLGEDPRMLELLVERLQG